MVCCQTHFNRKEGPFLVKYPQIYFQLSGGHISVNTIVIQGRNFEVPEIFHQYTEKRLKKLERLLDDEEIEIQVTVSSNRGRYTVEVTVRADGYIRRGEETGDAAHSPMDMVLEKLERQVEKYKTRLIKK